MTMTKIEEIRKNRFTFLNALYERTGGDRNEDLDMWTLGDELGFSGGQTETIVQYLEGEHLVAYTALGGYIAITHYGIKEVENAILNPDKPTHYFPPVNIIQIHHMEGSQIQQGVVSSTQSGTFNFSKTDNLKEFLETLKSQLGKLPLNNEDRDEITSDVETIESQIRSSRPKEGVVKECLKSIRNILEGATGSIVASGLLNQMATLF